MKRTTILIVVIFLVVLVWWYSLTGDSSEYRQYYKGYKAKRYLHIQYPTIDVVYTWVDGSDPEWYARKQWRLGRTVNSDATGINRWNDKNELKYSLRSVSKYAPWIRNIYLVTDRQRPKWLINHPRLKVIDHAQIIPERCLPTFNSMAIEMYLHRSQGCPKYTYI